MRHFMWLGMERAALTHRSPCDSDDIESGESRQSGATG